MEKNNKIGTWLSIGSPIIAEIASLTNLDWLLFDLEHGFGTEDKLLANLQASSNRDKSLIVRIGKMDISLISHALDWGAHGIMLPHVNSALQAKECLKAMHYPPIGKRGYSSSSRIYKYGFLNEVNSENFPKPLFFAQIETCEGVENAEEISSTDGVDVLFVGPSDLKFDFQKNGGLYFSSFDQAVETVLNAAKISNKKAGILVKNKEEFIKYIKMGFTYIAYCSDLTFLKNGFKSINELIDYKLPRE